MYEFNTVYMIWREADGTLLKTGYPPIITNADHAVRIAAVEQDDGWEWFETDWKGQVMVFRRTKREAK